MCLALEHFQRGNCMYDFLFFSRTMLIQLIKKYYFTYARKRPPYTCRNKIVNEASHALSSFAATSQVGKVLPFQVPPPPLPSTIILFTEGRMHSYCLLIGRHRSRATVNFFTVALELKSQ